MFIGFILADDLGNIIQGLGVYVPDDEIPTLKSTLVDGDKPDRIKFNPLYAWFVKVTKEAEELENKNKRGKKAQDSDSDAED